MLIAADLAAAELWSRIREQKHTLIADGLLFPPPDHIKGKPPGGADSSWLVDQLSTLGYGTQPNEEPTARRCTGFPNSSPRTKPDGSHKEGLIGRFAAI